MAQVDHNVIIPVKQFLRRISQCGIHIEAAYLFGSYAHNKANQWSDIDVAVVSPDFSDDRLAERIRLMRLSADIDSRIEPVPFHTLNFKDVDPLAGEIIKNGILLAQQ
jgi:uncharacterized protein